MITKNKFFYEDLMDGAGMWLQQLNDPICMEQRNHVMNGWLAKALDVWMQENCK